MIQKNALALCAGFGGLEIAVKKSFSKYDIDTQVVGYAEIDPKIADVFYDHYPSPNIGDITTADWAGWRDLLPPVHIVIAGYPCQPFSQAGSRKGIDDDRHLWPSVLECIRVLRPDYVILENVANHRRIGFGTVLGDLASVGYNARWTSFRASDAGAPHHRERVFILARPAHADRERQQERSELHV